MMRLLARPLYQAGTVMVVVGAGWLHAIHLAPEPYAFVGSPASRWWLVFTVVLVTIGYAVGLPELATSRAGALTRGGGATIAAFSVISAFQAILATPLLPRSSSMLIGLIQPVWTLLAWNLARDADQWAATRERVFLVVDRPEDHTSLVDDLADRPEVPARVVDWMTVEEVRRAGPERPLERRAADSGATVVVLDTAAQADPGTVDQAAELHRRGVRIRTLSLFYEHWIGKLPHAELARVSLLFDIGELHRARYVRLRRVVDLAFAAIGLIALAPVMAIVAVLNPWLNRGPLLFRQPRVGRDGVPFEIYKLRTMVPADRVGGGATDEAGVAAAWTSVGDQRITPLGRFLRRCHLDELPQVYNIVRGDLSLVGPRPEQPHYVEQLSDKIAFYDLRHIVRPGLTGWAQVKQGYAADDDDAFEKLQYDFYYLRRQGLALDLKIAWRTVRGVVGGDGR